MPCSYEVQRILLMSALEITKKCHINLFLEKMYNVLLIACLLWSSRIQKTNQPNNIFCRLKELAKSGTTAVSIGLRELWFCLLVWLAYNKLRLFCTYCCEHFAFIAVLSYNIHVCYYEYFFQIIWLFFGYHNISVIWLLISHLMFLSNQML